MLPKRLRREVEFRCYCIGGSVEESWRFSSAESYPIRACDAACALCPCGMRRVKADRLTVQGARHNIWNEVLHLFTLPGYSPAGGSYAGWPYRVTSRWMLSMPSRSNDQGAFVLGKERGDILKRMGPVSWRRNSTN